MNFRAHAIVVLLFAAVCIQADESEKSVPQENASSHKILTEIDEIQPTPTSDPAKTTDTPTAKPPPETTPKPTTTTTKPTTSTATPKPPPPPTTPPTPPTTPPTTPTPPPTTPSTVPPPTTPPTTPVPTTPAPPPTSWVVRAENGTVCIIAEMGIKITVAYPSKENKTINADFHVDKIKDANATGTCGTLNQTLILNWANGWATFNFTRNTTSSKYSLKGFDVTINVNNFTFPNISSGLNVSAISLKTDAEVFSVATNYSYTCSVISPLSLNGTVKNVTLPGTLYLSGVHVEAFGITKDAKYSAPKDCAGTNTPDIVPIAVGLILAGLVIVVLVAYLVGRRRAQARGYLSM